MKILQYPSPVLFYWLGWFLLSDARTPKPVIISAPEGVNTSWGHSVDISGKTLISGYTSYTGNTGGVFILEQKEKRWEVVNHFQTQNGVMRDWFGHAVAVSGDTAVIGAYEFVGKRGSLALFWEPVLDGSIPTGVAKLNLFGARLRGRRCPKR